MNTYLAVLEGKAIHEEKLRVAQRARRFLAAKRTNRLPALARYLLLILS